MASREQHGSTFAREIPLSRKRLRENDISGLGRRHRIPSRCTHTHTIRYLSPPVPGRQAANCAWEMAGERNSSIEDGIIGKIGNKKISKQSLGGEREHTMTLTRHRRCLAAVSRTSAVTPYFSAGPPSTTVARLRPSQASFVLVLLQQFFDFEITDISSLSIIAWVVFSARSFCFFFNYWL